MSVRRHTRRMVVGVGLLGLALAASGIPTASRAQEPEPAVDLGPPPRPVAILVADRPLVTVEVAGDYGPVRVTGILEGTPKAGVDLGSREASWNEVRALARVIQPSEGFPAGSFRAALVTDDLPATQASGSGVLYGLTTQQITGAWRALRLPEGNLTLRGKPYGTLSVPTSRILQYRMEPVRGDVETLPAGNLRIEVLPGTTVAVPLTEVQWLQRDLRRNAISVTLADDQTFSGKLVELPKVTIKFTGEMQPEPIALERIVVLERRTPSGRRF